MLKPVLFFVACCLSACSAPPGPIGPRVSVSLMQDDSFYIPDALGAAGRRFFGTAAAPVGAAPPLIDIDSDTLSKGSKTPYRQVHNAQMRIGAASDIALTRNLALTGSAALFQGNSRYILPKGAGVLIDPITVKFDSIGAEISTGLAWHAQTTPRLDSRVEFGLGGNVARTDTHITSALLDVRNRATQRAGFVYTDFGIGFAPVAGQGPRLRLGSRIKGYPGQGVSIQTGLTMTY